MVRQLGFDVNDVVAKLARQKQAAAGDCHEPTGAIERVKGQTTPEVMPPKADGDSEIEDFVRRTWHEIWNWRLFDRILRHYAPNYLCHTDNRRELYGQDQYIQWVMSLLATFPDGQMKIDHFCALGDPQGGYRVALRWTFLGTHLMPGIYGEPTGKPVRIMGISHLHVKDGRFVAEWTLIDELAVRVNLYTPDS
jgi:predicted ester cyclase